MLYHFTLPTPVNGQTHVQVVQSIVDGRRVNITGTYGILDSGDGSFTPGESMLPFDTNIFGEEREDLIVQSNAAGRPDTLKDHEFREADMIAHLEGDPVAREARVVGRRPVVEETGPPFDPAVDPDPEVTP